MAAVGGLGMVVIVPLIWWTSRSIAWRHCNVILLGDSRLTGHRGIGLVVSIDRHASIDNALGIDHWHRVWFVGVGGRRIGRHWCGWRWCHLRYLFIDRKRKREGKRCDIVISCLFTSCSLARSRAFSSKISRSLAVNRRHLRREKEERY